MRAITLTLTSIVSVSRISPSLGFSLAATSTGTNTNTNTKVVSIVTGARGYLGRQVVRELLENSSCGSANGNGNNKCEILCLVREKNVNEEQRYWDKVMNMMNHNMVNNNNDNNNDNDNDSNSNSNSNVNEKNVCLKVMPYDMLDGGKSVSRALNYALESDIINSNGEKCQGQHQRRVQCCVYHIASIFTPTEDHYQMALDNVKGTVDLMNAIVQMKQKNRMNTAAATTATNKNNIRVVLTSSTAAVRGPNQTPLNGRKFYNHEDWNTASEHGLNWGHSYQWSKATSEKRAWEISREHDIPMSSIAPSFIFGPPNLNGNGDSSGDSSGDSDGDSTSSPSSTSTSTSMLTTSSYSIKIINSWIHGEAAVQSRLCVDIRDVASAHRLAGSLDSAIGQRIIVSSECRLPSTAVANEFRRIAKEVAAKEVAATKDPDDLNCEELLPQEKIDAIHADTEFDGGAIAIGDKEVDAKDRLMDILGMECRPVEETMADMARTLFEMYIHEHKQKKQKLASAESQS